VRSPASPSACNTQHLSVSAVQPLLADIEATVAHWDEYSPRCSAI